MKNTSTKISVNNIVDPNWIGIGNTSISSISVNDEFFINGIPTNIGGLADSDSGKTYIVNSVNINNQCITYRDYARGNTYTIYAKGITDPVNQIIQWTAGMAGLEPIDRFVVIAGEIREAEQTLLRAIRKAGTAGLEIAGELGSLQIVHTQRY